MYNAEECATRKATLRRHHSGNRRENKLVFRARPPTIIHLSRISSYESVACNAQPRRALKSAKIVASVISGSIVEITRAEYQKSRRRWHNANLGVDSINHRRKRHHEMLFCRRRRACLLASILASSPSSGEKSARPWAGQANRPHQHPRVSTSELERRNMYVVAR